MFRSAVIGAIHHRRLYILSGPQWYLLLSSLQLHWRQWKSKSLDSSRNKSRSTQIVVTHKPWEVILCIASTVLMFASLISPIVHHFLIEGTEIMINISSLATRSNPHIPLPDGGTFLEASDPARILKGVCVRYGDIDSKASVGNLANGAVGASGSDIARIKRIV